MPEIYCSAVNNGMTSGSGAAYHKLVKGMLEKQDLSMAKKDLALFTEMRILNMLGKRHVDRVLLGISFTGAFYSCTFPTCIPPLVQMSALWIVDGMVRLLMVHKIVQDEAGTL
mgnify:CR=1 FL=1